jgi:hypothetical protein
MNEFARKINTEAKLQLTTSVLKWLNIFLFYPGQHGHIRKGRATTDVMQGLCEVCRANEEVPDM